MTTLLASDLSALLGGSTILFVLVAVYVIFALPLYAMAQKLGIENPWFAFVPILNMYLLTQIGGLDWWYLLLLFVPCVNLFVIIYLWMKAAEAMNKPNWVGILTIVPVVGVFVPFYIAFG